MSTPTNVSRVLRRVRKGIVTGTPTDGPSFFLRDKRYLVVVDRAEGADMVRRGDFVDVIQDDGTKCVVKIHDEVLVDKSLTSKKQFFLYEDVTERYNSGYFPSVQMSRYRTIDGWTGWEYDSDVTNARVTKVRPRNFVNETHLTGDRRK